MKIATAGTVAASLLALALAACGSEGGHGGMGGGGGPSSAADCSQLTSCSACTPVVGCGWCYDSDGRGACAADPRECATPSFSWTWNPEGCRVPAEAGVVPASTSSAPEGGSEAASEASTD